MNERRVVYLIDDDEAIRRSAGFLLRTSGFDVRAYASGTAFLKESRGAEPGCILLDVRMPNIDGLEVQRVLNERGVSMPVIVLTGHGDVGIAVTAMKAGAVDFLEKPFEKSVLLAAISSAFDRLGHSDGSVTSAHEARVRLAALTPREHDVLVGLVRGHPNKTIAFDLGISPRTVEVHRANLMSKLGVRTLSDALRIAFAAGLGSENGD